MRIKTKILIPVITLTLLVSAAIMVSNIVLFSDFVDETTAGSVAAASKAAVNNLDFIKREAAAASLSMAENREVIRALVNGDRDGLMTYAGQLQDKTGIEFCTVTDPDGIVLLRTHAPEISEDSVTSQANIRAAMSGEILTVIEEGTVIRLSVRAGAPVYDDSGTLVGVVSVGYRLDTEQFVDSIKKISDCEATVFLGDERIATTVLKEDGTRALGTKADSHISEAVLAGTPYTGEADILGRTAFSSYIPLYGPDGRSVGMLFVGRYTEESAEITQAFVRRGLIIALIMLAVFISVILIIVRRIVTPIRDMTGAAAALAEGDTDIDVRVNTTDEMRTLANAFNSMVENARRQLRVIENIADGNPAGPVEARSEKDLVNRALGKLNETIMAQAAAIREEHERIQLMMDATPLASRLWDRNFNMIECNEAAVKLFGLKDKREYMDRYFELSPEFQPNGRKTDEMVRMTVNEAFERGACTYEWMYRMPDGTPVPAENTFVRVPYREDYAVAAYSRDLREQEKMMSEIVHRGSLLETGNRVLSVLFNTAEDEDIETVLTESMEILGTYTGAGGIYITQNEMIDGALHFTCRYAWMSEPERGGKAMLPGMMFPYGLEYDWDSRFRQGQCMNGPVVSFYPEIREFFAPFEVKSALVIPVFVQEQFWGLVGFSDYVNERFFADDEVDILRSMSLMMAAAVNRGMQAAAIREAHNRARILTNATPIGFNLWNRDFENIETNDTAVRLFGLNDHKEYLERFFELSPEYQPDGNSSREKAKTLLREAFETGYNQFEWLHRKPDGTDIPMEITLVRVDYEDGRAVAGYMRDLREHKKMAAESERHDRLLRTVNEAADILLRSEPDDFSDTLSHCMGMMAGAINADRMFLNKNSVKDGKLYHTRLHEWPAETLPAQETAPAAAVSYDAGTPAIREALMRGEYVRGAVRDMASADRERLGMRGIRSVLLLPVFIRGEFWGVVGFGNCRSERLFTENEASVMRSGILLIANAWLRNEYTLNIAETSAMLETALEEAKQANRAKSDFLASISHEMRTPLNAIIGLSEIALDDAGANEDTKSNLEKIYNSGSTLLSIVNDLLDISKVQAGKFVILENQYDVPSMVNDAILQNVLRIGSRPIRFILDIDENIPACLHGDELRVKQIINNLLSNAIKYTEEGAVQLSIIGLRDGEDVWLTVRVRDTGVGIRPEHLNRLFSDYTQFGTTSHQRAGGTGLGLAITKSLTEIMGGGVTVESIYGEGSVFTAMLKQRYVNEAVIGPRVAESLKRLQYSTNKLDFNLRLNRIKLPYARVLVVDDNITNLDVARGFMKPYGMKTDCVTSGKDAVRAIRDEKVKYSAVFMDHMMPEMDGIEAARIIREEIGTEYARTIPIIALTANAVSGSEEMFLKNGFQGFISKPIDPARLDEMIRRFVRDKDREAPAGVSQASAERRSGKDRRVSGDRDRTGLSAFRRKLDGVDIPRGIELYGDEPSFIRILRSYAINTKPLLESIKEVSEDTLGDYAITVHGLKGASRNIFAEDAGMSAEELEHAAKAGDFDFVARENPAFLESIRKLVEDIDSVLDKIAKSTPKQKKEKPGNDDLMRLYAACRDYDFNAVDAIMEGIERYEYTDDEGLAGRLRENITQMNWTRVMEMLSFLNGGNFQQT